MPVPANAAETLAAVRKSPGNRVRVAVADIDGILRGKYLHKDKFASAIETGFGFCDVVFGWDCHDQCYDNTTLTGWHKGFPDALARIDLGTHRRVPWDDGVDFFLGEFIVRDANGDEPFPLDGRQVLKRVLKRAEKLGVIPMCGLEFEWFNFIETPQSWADKQGVGPTPLTRRSAASDAGRRSAMAASVVSWNTTNAGTASSRARAARPRPCAPRPCRSGTSRRSPSAPRVHRP